MKNFKWKQFFAVGAIGILIGGLGGALLLPREVETEVIVEKNVTVEVPYNVTVEVEVDNGNLDLVLQHIYDNNGFVEYLTEDLDDDEVEQIVDKIVFVNEVRKLAVDAVRADLYDEVDKLEVTDGEDVYELDEDELRRLRINDDADELEVTIEDWEDREAIVHVTGSFKQDGTKFNFETDVVFEDGEFDDLEAINVEVA